MAAASYLLSAVMNTDAVFLIVFTILSTCRFNECFFYNKEIGNGKKRELLLAWQIQSLSIITFSLTEYGR